MKQKENEQMKMIKITLGWEKKMDEEKNKE